MELKYKRWALATVAAMFAAACAQQPNTTAQNAQDENAAPTTVAQTEEKRDVVCRSRHSVGSHFRKTRCMSREQAAKEREQSIDAMERAKQSSMSGAIKSEGR